MNTDGEAVIMLAFQASGRGSTPLQCTQDSVIFVAILVFILGTSSSTIASSTVHVQC